jgi:hypothetical protein
MKGKAMNRRPFAVLSRTVARIPSRRDVLRCLVSTGLGLAVLPMANAAEGKNKHHKKHNKKQKKPRTQPPPPSPDFNQFGCLDAGQPCQGDSTLCCSGICEGVAPKPGKPDTSTCVGHSVGRCTPELSLCLTDDVTTSRCNLPEPGAFCLTTTGNAGFCASNAGFDYALSCQPCLKDNDCEALGFQVGSACVILQGGSFCRDECAATGGRACLPPAI